MGWLDRLRGREPEVTLLDFDPDAPSESRLRQIAYLRVRLERRG